MIERIGMNYRQLGFLNSRVLSAKHVRVLKGDTLRTATTIPTVFCFRLQAWAKYIDLLY